MSQPVIYLRPPASLKARLQEAAKQNRRTLNQEVIARLEASLTQYRKF
jgi:predicted HicB family RNase H-like nuclease